MSALTSSKGRWLVWLLVLALFVLHQDCWFWDDKSLVFGFMPVGLFYHALFSIAATVTWALANKLAWPEEIEAWADEGSSDKGGAE